MHPIFLGLLAISTMLLSQAKADFFVYQTDYADAWNPFANIMGLGYRHMLTWIVLPQEMQHCDELMGPIPYWWQWSDVSGDTSGVRCYGCAGHGDNTFSEIEFNFHGTNPTVHFTIYARSVRGNKPFDMVGLDGRKLGNCTHYWKRDIADFHCEPAKSHILLNGYKQFFCESEYTAMYLNDARNEKNLPKTPVYNADDRKTECIPCDVDPNSRLPKNDSREVLPRYPRYFEA